MVQAGSILDIALRERIGITGRHIAEIVHVGPVGEHIGNPELAATSGVGVSRHNHDEPLAAQLERRRMSFENALDTPGGIPKGNEPLQEFGVGVLDVVEVADDVRTHGESPVQLHQFGGRCDRAPPQGRAR